MIIDTYLQQFESLHTAKIAGQKAPHKAVLLLAIIDLVESGVIVSSRIELSEILEETFCTLWKRFVGDSPFFRPAVSTPFWHLLNEPFYRLYLTGGHQIKGGIGRYSIKWLRKNTYAVIDEQILLLFQDKQSRAELRTILINSYIKALQGGVK